MRIDLGTKIYLVAGFLIAIALLIGLSGLYDLRAYEHTTEGMANASERAVLAERMNGLVFAAVMDSRGIYMSATHEEAEKYAGPLLKSLDNLKATLRQWREATPAAQQGLFRPAEEAVNTFVQFRTELVRLSREGGLPEARAFGDNDANRKARAALNEQLKGLADNLNKEVASASDLIKTEYSGAIQNLASFLALGLLLGTAATAWVVKWQVLKPLRAITSTMKILSNGDLNVEIPFAESADEIGEMAASIHVFKSGMVETERLQQEKEQERKASEVSRRSGVLAMAEDFERSVGDLVRGVAAAATEMQSTAEHMVDTSEGAGNKANTAAVAAQQTASNVQSVAVAIDELSTSFNEISKRIGESTEIISSAATQSNATTHEVQNLQHAATKIGEVVKLISDIAEQTNLLALNATIEAARAGEAGRGFAVVASEVKALANQTSKATGEISSQISEIQTVAKRSANAISGIAETINRVNQIATAIAAAVEEQTATATEIARNVSRAAEGTTDVTRNVVSVSHGAQETSAAASQVLSAAAELSKNGEALSGQVNRFLATVRAA